MQPSLVKSTHVKPSAAKPPAAHLRPFKKRREGVAGYVFLTPWMLGLLGITAVPMLGSLVLSFTDYDLLSPFTEVKWVGLKNYAKMFGDDPHYWHAVQVTLIFGLVAVPLKLSAALGVAVLLNRERRFTGWFRGLFYLPSLLGGSVALALVWRAMWSRDGAFNSLFGLEGPNWINEPDYALGTLVVLAVWQFGAPMVIFLAGLKQIPSELYEAASVDGANKLRSFWHITLPGLSPVIFFNLVLETIHGFQGFTSAFVISGGTGGPIDATLMYTLYLYKTGWSEYQMGYASAMAWVFLVAIAIITAVLFSTGKFWVHYGDNS
jgi:multiple sugar transport system permease protein